MCARACVEHDWGGRGERGREGEGGEGGLEEGREGEKGGERGNGIKYESASVLASPHGLSLAQGMDTPICSIVTAATRHLHPLN